MKKIILLLSTSLLTYCSIAQKTIVELFVPAQIKATSASLSPDNTKDEYQHEYHEDGWELTAPIVKGKAVFEQEIQAPQFITLYVDKLPPARLFLTPGDHLVLRYQETNGKKNYTVTGEGSHNNQSVVERRFGDYYQKYEKDTLPARLLRDLQARHQDDQLLLASYINKHKPSAAFIAAQEAELQYFQPQVFYSFVGNHKFKLQSHPRKDQLLRIWQQAADSIIATVPLSNDEALVAPNYTQLISSFLTRKKEAIWESFGSEEGQGRKEWLQDEPDSGKALMSDIQNLLTAKIIKRYFTGKAAEFAYTHLLHEAVGEKEDNLLAIYDAFVQQFPNSIYQPYLAPRLEPVRQRFARPLNDKMVIVPNSTSLTSFAEVKALVKGKTVLLDMWGTWCGPCRQELNEHSQALKDHFKGKGVTFLYISNHDLQAEAKWKALIPYYNLEGTHILASGELTQDIVKAIKLTGYPTYVIIKKDGSFELSKAGYPMDRAVLIKQLEAAL